MSIPRKCAIYTLLLVTVFNCPLLLYAAYSLYSAPHTPVSASVTHEYSYIGADHPTQLPITLPAIHVPLQAGSTEFSLYADDAWSTLFPSADGFTDLGPLHSDHKRTFLVSMVHQLHCLDVFRVGFATNRSHYAHHVEHCLWYMLQMVLCHADATLEPDEPGMRGGRWEHAAGGVGSVHECKDWRVLRRYLDEHPAGPVTL